MGTEAEDEEQLSGGRALDRAIRAALDEPCDLTRAERLRILVALRDLDSRTLWDVLGLHGTVSDADVKRAYFDLSKSFHPDRFFKKNLGTFGPKLDRLFYGIKAAYDVLADSTSRAKYALQHPIPQRGKSL